MNSDWKCHRPVQFFVNWNYYPFAALVFRKEIGTKITLQNVSKQHLTLQKSSGSVANFDFTIIRERNSSFNAGNRMSPAIFTEA